MARKIFVCLNYKLQLLLQNFPSKRESREYRRLREKMEKTAKSTAMMKKKGFFLNGKKLRRLKEDRHFKLGAPTGVWPSPLLRSLLRCPFKFYYRFNNFWKKYYTKFYKNLKKISHTQKSQHGKSSCKKGLSIEKK